MSAGPSPTVRRRRLAAELRRLRETAGLTIDEAAERLEVSGSKISRIETGRVSVHPRDVRDLLDLYGVTDQAELEALVTIAREARQKGWWTAYADVLTGSYVGLEAEAASIRTYHAQLVPGLLQVEAYARAVIRALRPTADAETIERRVAARLTRQELLTRDDPPRFWGVLDEAVLRRPVGGPEVMREQLLRLAESCERPNVTIQVLPFAAGAHAGMEGAFVLLEFPEQADPDVAYVEGLMGDVYLEKSDEVGPYSLAFDHLRAVALSPDESVAMIVAAAKDLHEHEREETRRVRA